MRHNQGLREDLKPPNSPQGYENRGKDDRLPASLKVKGTLSVEDLSAAIRNRNPTIKIDEYDAFGLDGVGVRRYSRPHDGFGPRH